MALSVYEKPMEITLTEKEYQQAGMMVSRRCGALRICVWLSLVGVLLVAAAFYSLNWISSRPSSFLAPIALMLAGVLLLVICLAQLPRAEKRRLSADFVTFVRLMQPAAMTMGSDELVVKSENMTLHDPYGLIIECVETPEMFIFIKDKERFSVLPKRCLPAEKKQDILDYLRLQFTRRYHAMKNWLF